MASFPAPTLEQLFNTPLEVGLRCLILLVEVKHPCDLHRLKIFDYFLLHSEDVEGGPNSLHPPSPFRSSELLVRYSLIEQGVRLLIAKGLITPHLTEDGIQYETTVLSSAFLYYFESEYAVRARGIARWVGNTFGGLDSASLQQYVSQNIGQWGAEFTAEPLLEEEAE